MAIKLSKGQQDSLKKMMGFCEVFADEILLIMRDHGLDKIQGCSVSINVNPHLPFLIEDVRFGQINSDSGIINLGKGYLNETFTPYGRNSAEYELLFADEAVRKAIQEGLNRKKPLPPDGLWVGANNNSDPVDDWEWDLNDSLS